MYKTDYMVTDFSLLIFIDINVSASQHLYYARFVNYFLHSVGLVKDAEPFRSVLCQGMIKGRTYKTSEGKYLKSSEVKITGNELHSSSNLLAKTDVDLTYRSYCRGHGCVQKDGRETNSHVGEDE